MILILATTQCFASSKNINMHYAINSVQELKAEISNIDVSNLSDEQKKKLIKEINPIIASEFIDEKFQVLENKMRSFVNVGEGKITIDLGDNCEATIYTTDDNEELIRNINDGICLRDSTPGAETNWYPYGKRKFTSTFEVRTGILDVDLKLISHYTLSSKGVSLRYGESEVIKKSGDIDLGSASAGSVNTVKETAYTKGEKIHINSIFSYRWAPACDITIISRQFKMHNYVKFSDVDKTSKEVKVVKSWNGTHI